MSTRIHWLAALRRPTAALIYLLALPFAEASEIAPPPLSGAVAQLRQAVGLWNVTTTQYGENGTVTRVGSGTYRFDWVVPDRVLAGRSDFPEWAQSSGILFYINEHRSTLEMASVGTDGQLQVMAGPAGGEIRSSAPIALADGRKMQVRVTRFNVASNRFESRMETSCDGGASWRPGHHQLFVRAPVERGGSGSGLRYRPRPQPYVPLT